MTLDGRGATARFLFTIMVLFAAVSSAVTGCGSDSGSMTVFDPWARPSPPDTDATALYVVVTNETGRVQRLVNVQADRCPRIELHRTDIDDDGVATMNPAGRDDMTVAPNGELAFEPGALHIMCQDVVEPLVAGQDIRLTLTFDNTEPLDIVVPVRVP